MQLLTKDNVIKLLVILLVFAFLLEIFAFQNPSNVPTNDNTQTTTDQTTQGELFGTALANGTVVSYGDAYGVSITALGNSSELSSAVSKLKSEGHVTYTSPVQSGTSINLAKGANLSYVVGELSKLNITLEAGAEVSIKDPLLFKTDNGTVSTVVRSIKIKLNPSIPVGSRVGLRIIATLSGEKMTKAMYEIIPISQDILVIGRATELYPNYVAIGVLDWTGRYFESNVTMSYLSQQFNNVSMQSIINNTVMFSPMLDPTAAQKLSSLNLSYARNSSQRGILFYQNFTDNATLKRDLLPVLEISNTTLMYPLSYVRFDFKTQNYSEEFLNSSLPAATFFVYRESKIQIGEKIADDEGRNYTVINREYTTLLPYSNETGSASIINIRASIMGDKILNYTILDE
jgi:hypothetical protein